MSPALGESAIGRQIDGSTDRLSRGLRRARRSGRPARLVTALATRLIRGGSATRSCVRLWALQVRGALAFGVVVVDVVVVDEGVEVVVVETDVDKAASAGSDETHPAGAGCTTGSPGVMVPAQPKLE